MKYLALDYESSGLKAYAHAPISLAVCVFEAGVQVGEPFYEKWPLMEDLAYTPKALQINGESYEEIAGRTGDELEIMKCLEEWATRNDAHFLPIVAHNAEFDMSFYQACVTRTRQDPLLGGWQCTMRIAKKYPGMQGTAGAASGGALRQTKFSLDATAGRFGFVRQESTHDALEDAQLVGKVFWSLMGTVAGERSKVTTETQEGWQPQ